LHQFRLYGTKGAVIVDDDHQIVLRIDNREYKSYLRLFMPPIGVARQYVANVAVNVHRFLRNAFHLPNEAGLLTLIGAFYRSVDEGTPVPIAYREIVLTSRIMDAAFAHITTHLEQRAARDVGPGILRGGLLYANRTG
jgi:predicted dehydrogenase